MTSSDLDRERDRLGLRADCENCFGLCCVAPSFKASADFAIDKRSGTPCPNLLAEFGCGIHAHLRERGFRGCTTYDCFGAGQKVSQVMFKGRSWRSAPETAERMFQVLPVMRELHQLLWQITEALHRAPAGVDCDALRQALQDTELLTTSDPDDLSWGEVDRHGRAVQTLLDEVTTVRAADEDQGPTQSTGGASGVD